MSRLASPSWRRWPPDYQSWQPAVGGIPEIVRPGVTGKLVGPDDAAAMAASIVRILTIETLAEAMGATGMAAAREHTSNQMVEHYFSLYSEFLSARTGT